MTKLTQLPERGVLEVAGEDRVAFLQGLVSNDVTLARPGQAVWGALLTPQGKWLADFFILSDGQRLLLDVEQAQVAMLLQRLARFRLRSRVSLRDVSAELFVHVAWNGVPEIPQEAVAAPDPRLPDAGWRILSPVLLSPSADTAEWDAWRLVLGLPDGSRDLEPEKTVLLEAGFDELNGISWTKGCYMGQELTARTKYRGLLKRRLVPVVADGALPPPGTPVMRADVEVGTLRSGRGDRALALLRIEVLDGPLAAGEATLRTNVPSWMAVRAA
jgi:folate-binding protein YgfZ